MRKYKDVFETLFKEVGKVVVGQEEMIVQVMVAILSDSHALLEGYPGLAKTLTIRTISDLMDLKFSRIQNTPDLMPSDITGTFIIEEERGKKEFKFQPGPIFANIVLADEINRATPKTQSALLEAMQEKQVTVGNKTYTLDRPFFVLATQNPVEQEGTYPLPEAQADRFLLKIKVSYPTAAEELEIVERYTGSGGPPKLRTMFNKETIKSLQELARQVPIADDIKKRAIKIVFTTRDYKQKIEYGASPRASIGLINAAKGRALILGRNHVSNEDVDAMAYPILRHRIILNFEAERQGMKEDDVIRELLDKIK
ncbi:MoxR family ATPase [Candidatus Woesearchaeota archaeon]|nr:MAG: MoxR-like protein ATPase [archaeon GW2011_AR4]MBS3130692.1 MoxR family ATPase [Candidatus Woesearchaeota archaeon]HIH38845.1 MoxR family ATPase [Candidatus Woesearchaeota archaeon]HIH48914.1 MoxR family ATPase [Candidatus Woesearchaeota archaeon]HIJ04332.1 MoxR family ATPase [Candidatus Woesearchaeota archaeon]